MTSKLALLVLVACAPVSARRVSEPESVRCTDEVTRYARGDLREVYFYPAQRTGHTERTYRPGR